MKVLLKYLKKYKTDILISTILISIAAASTLILPKLMEKAVAYYSVNPGDVIAFDKVKEYGVYMIIVAAIGLVTGIVNSFYTSKISQNVGADMRNDGFKKIQTYSYEDVEHFKGSNLVVRLTNDINQIQTVLMAMFSTLIRIPILLVGSFVLAMITMPQLWYVIVFLMIAVVIVLMLVMRRAFPMFKTNQNLVDSINTSIKENFDGVRVVKSFSTEQSEMEKFDAETNKLADITRKIGHIFAIVIPVFMLIVNMALVYVIYATIDLAKADPSLATSLFSYTQYLSQIMMALIIGGMVMMQVSRAMVSIKRFDEIMERVTNINYPEEGLEKIKGKIEFRNVSFTYPNDEKPSLTDVSFTINAGETIGIIGATGSGKSTLVHLILRLYDVSSGAIYLDDVNIKDIPKDTLRNDISIVLQRPILFSGSIKDNLLPEESQDTKALEQAANDAQASEFINRLGAGFDSEVMQRGSNFSGGQKQRLSIARALVGKPPIIVLDDSTSALDARSEKLVKDALFKSYQDETIIIIAQKITSVIDANQIIVLDGGHVDAIGSHKDLVQKSAIYNEIFATQKGGHNNETR